MFYKVVYVLCRILFGITNHRVRVHHPERLPAGAVVLCPNHTALRDPIYVAAACDINSKMRFMAKSELYRNRLLGWFLSKLGAFPVERGKADMDAIRFGIRCLQEGCRLVIFPEGTRVTPEKHVEARAGALMIAGCAGVPVVPVYIRNARTFFRPVDLTFGEPITVSRSREGQREALRTVMNAIEEMRCQ